MRIETRYRILIGVSLITVIATILAPAIPQDPVYHQFADQNNWLSIPNSLNVLSNLFFAWIGCVGLYRLSCTRSLHIDAGVFPAYFGFFLALILIAIGSGIYHWSPDNGSLSLDRMPISIAFMSFFSVIIGERISIRLARKAFPVLVVAGISSVVYWYYSELAGDGDLRPYALFQVLPVLLTPLLLLMFDSRYTRSSDIWWFMAWFLASRLFEVLDYEVYDWLILVSGHSLKHIAASVGCLVFLRHLYLRRSIQS